jgi:hypothetical protein
LHSDSPEKFDRAAEILLAGVEYGPEEVPSIPIVLERVE